MTKKALPLLVSLFISSLANAFPEMVRHGYVHCTTCHVSPAGGGLLTAYGRSLSKELLSRWSAEGEEQIVHGALQDTTVSKWLNSEEDTGFFAGGDVRWIQTHMENDQRRVRTSFLMQADLEGAYRWSWGSFGLAYGQEWLGPPDSTVLKHVVLRRWNFVTRLFDTVWTRAGLGSPHWGIVSSEHIWAFRQNLGFGPQDHHRLIEIENQGERWGALIGASENDETLPETAREKSVYGFADLILGVNKKIGLDLWEGSFPNATGDVKRTMYGAHGMVGWNEHWVTIAQLTSQKAVASGGNLWSRYLFQKTSWEFTKGLWASFITDLSQTDQSNENTRTDKYGLGMQFFPRPHLEVQFDYLRVKDRSVSQNEGDMGFFIFHYYL